ncbi:hydrogenase maturation nickel metallochaperone HypA [Actinoplanes sp. NPDC051513]|uniref:hydrogenase maturation nickel metallochaperone HypA n=1 Tax=Actinoplanes sp. NPDC051513 TaxID=3363908 RepID=UPI00379A6B81
MHELAIAENIVDAVCERADGRPVRRVTVRIGKLTAVVPRAMLFCFDLATEGTVAEGARLEIEERAGEARCRTCGAEVVLADPILLCPCGSADLAVTAGRELQIVSMEVG